MTDPQHLEVITILAFAGKKLSRAGHHVDATGLADVVDWLLEQEPTLLTPWPHGLTYLAERPPWGKPQPENQSPVPPPTAPHHEEN